jgi:hypothetical protein
MLVQRVLAMILNGLGFTNDRLYLVPRFFQNKPVDRLIGPGIESEHLNYSVSRLNEPKVSEAKYKFDFSAKFILRPSWSAKFILRFDFLNITVLYSIGKRYIIKK